MIKDRNEQIRAKKNDMRVKYINQDIQTLKKREAILEEELKRVRTKINDKHEERAALKKQ